LVNVADRILRADRSRETGPYGIHWSLSENEFLLGQADCQGDFGLADAARSLDCSCILVVHSWALMSSVSPPIKCTCLTPSDCPTTCTTASMLIGNPRYLWTKV
jgi:hypothetical protein